MLQSLIHLKIENRREDQGLFVIVMYKNQKRIIPLLLFDLYKLNGNCDLIKKYNIKSTTKKKSILIPLYLLLNKLKKILSAILISPPLIFCKSFSFKATNCSNLTVFFIIKSPQCFFSCKLTYKNNYTK